jgi:fatty acid desaturase
MTKRGRIVGYGLAALLVAIGAVGAALAGGGGQLLALVFIGLGFVLATSLVFFEVGLSEDREREREREAARRREQARLEMRERSKGAARSRPRPRLERRRGRPRRLR